jgi:hypothetical protein
MAMTVKLKKTRDFAPLLFLSFLPTHKTPFSKTTIDETFIMVANTTEGHRHFGGCTIPMKCACFSGLVRHRFVNFFDLDRKQ